MLHQQGDILAPIAQWGQLDLDHLDAVEKIIAHFAFDNPVGQWGI
jgi:hypothetical protein